MLWRAQNLGGRVSEKVVVEILGELEVGVGGGGVVAGLN